MKPSTSFTLFENNFLMMLTWCFVGFSSRLLKIFYADSDILSKASLSPSECQTINKMGAHFNLITVWPLHALLTVIALYCCCCVCRIWSIDPSLIYLSILFVALFLYILKCFEWFIDLSDVWQWLKTFLEVTKLIFLYKLNYKLFINNVDYKTSAEKLELTFIW